MNDKIISGRALNALSAVLHELRPDWHEPGILDALAKATDNRTCRDGWHLAVSAIRAASELTNRTPRVIALDGKHWEERVKEPVRPIVTGAEIRTCPRGCRYSEPDSEHQCAPKAAKDSSARALAREVAAKARGEYERAMGERQSAQEAAT